MVNKEKLTRSSFEPVSFGLTLRRSTGLVSPFVLYLNAFKIKLCGKSACLCTYRDSDKKVFATLNMLRYGRVSYVCIL